jgi:hypothetical protein
MQRLLAVAIGFALCASLGAGVVLAEPGGSTTGPTAVAAKKCKKHKRHGHKRCHKKGAAGDDKGGANGGNGNGSSGGGSQAPCTNTPSSPGRAAAFESEYTISLSRPSVGCGTVILQQDTHGAMDPHDLILRKEGDPAPSFGYAQLGPGSTASQTLNLSRGTWILYCDIQDHQAKGMEVALTVN